MVTLLLRGTSPLVRANTNESTSLGSWEKSLTLRAGAGYNDNVLLSPKPVFASAATLLNLDAVLYRWSLSGSEWYLYLSGEDIRYLSQGPVDKEQNAVAKTQWKHAWDSGWQGSMDLDYLYVNQVFDASATEDIFHSVKAIGHTLAWRPSVLYEWSNRYRAELEFGLSRQWFQQPLDSYWEYGPRLSLARLYRRRSELRLSYEFLRRPYDTRLQATTDGFSLPGTRLVYFEHQGLAGWEHYFDEPRRWRNWLRLGLVWNVDNGSGYYDYTRYLASEQIRYRTPNWEAAVQAKLSYYDYALQTAEPYSGAGRYKTLFSLSARGERRLARHVKWFLEFEREQSLANLPLDQYAVNRVFTGLDVEF